MQKAGKEAGQAFERAATIQSKNLNEPDDAANTLTEAFKSYRKDEPEEAARVLSQAINHYTLKGNFRRAATFQQQLAELFEVELGDQKRAMEAYESAAGWYETDNAEQYVLHSLRTWELLHLNCTDVYRTDSPTSSSSKLPISLRSRPTTTKR